MSLALASAMHDLLNVRPWHTRWYDWPLGWPAADRYHGGVGADSHWNAHMTKTPEAYIIQAVLPGLSKNDVNLSITDDRHVRITAELSSGNKESGSYSQQSFAQDFYVPKDGDLENAGARMNNGILEVTLPRVKPVRNPARSIQIA